MCVASCVHALVPLPRMGRGKFRTLKALYQYGSQQGSLPTQPFTFEMEEKSRSCNVCATWYSSCVHFQRVAVTVGVGIDNFTDKTDEAKRTSQCSYTDGILFFPSLSSACDHSQHTSSEASNNVFSVSSSHDTFSENAESRATYRDSDSCKDVESLLNVRKAQPCTGSGGTAKGLTNFGDQRFSNQLEKHKELDIIDDNISRISRSDSADLARGNQNGGPVRKNPSCRSASDHSFSVVEKDVKERLSYRYVAGTHFGEANGIYHVAQNFMEEPSLGGVVLPNRSDQSAISSLKDFYDCAILVKGELPECSSEQVESSLARAALSRLDSWRYGVYSCACATSVGTDLHLNCIETESRPYCKRHIQKSTSVIRNTIMQESRQIQQADPRVVIDLTDEVIVCDICGDVGEENSLAICSKCSDGAEHIYCMRFKLKKVPGNDWMCEECMVRSECKKSESQIEGLSSTSCLPAKRCGAPLKALSVKKRRVIGVSAESPRLSKPCYSPCKKFENGKVKATKNITSELRISCNSQENAKAPYAWGDRQKERILEAGSDKKRRDPETRVTFPEVSKPSKQSLVSRGTLLKNSGKAKLEAARSVCSVKQSSSGFEEKPKLPKLGSQNKIARDKCSLLKSGSSKTEELKFKRGMAKGGCLKKQKVDRNLASVEIRKGRNVRMVSKSVSFNSVSSEKLNATCSEVILENAYRPVVFKNSSSAEQTETAREKHKSKLDNTTMCLPASDSGATAAKSGNKTICRDENSSGPNCGRLDTVHSFGQLECRLQPKRRNTDKDQNSRHGEKKNNSQQAEQPAEAAATMKVHKLSICLGSDARSHLEAAILSQDIVIPKHDYIWLGKFHLQRSEGIACECDGLQAHLSTCASPKVLEVVDRFPETVVLEELPRLRMWPSQFMESQPTEENIALYFFAKDLSSYTTYYQKLMEYMTKNDLALKGNFNGVELLIFPSNVLPENSQRWNKLLFLWGVLRGRKVNNSEDTPGSSSQKRESRDILSSWPLDLNAYPDDGYDMVGDEDVQGQLPIEDKNNADNVEVHGNLPVEEKNNADNVEPSRPPSLSVVLPIYEENRDLLDWQAAETLVLLSEGLAQRL